MNEAPAYIAEGNDASLVRLIKDGAIFIREHGTSDVPTGPEWTPTNGANSRVGYYSEDGFTLEPSPGDTTTIAGHNGDDVIEEQAPGFWTLGFAGIEGNKHITAAYFDVDVASDGSVTVTTAATNRRYDVVVVGLDQLDRAIIGHFPNVKISEREGLSFNRTTLLAYGLTFRTFKGTGASPYHFKAWGLAVPTVESIEVAGLATVAVEASITLSATAQLSDGSSRTVTNEVAWTSSDVAKATVSSAGLVTGVATGSATITATLGSRTTTHAVSVTGAP